MPQLPAEMTDYEQLIDDYSHFAPPAEGEVLQGHVLKVTQKEVIVDFGYKSEGLVPIAQFVQPDGSVHVHPGDTIDVVIDHHGEEVEGYILLSHEKASRLRAWDNLEKAYREQLLVSGRVLGRIKGGLAVDVGVKAFMPGSHADVRPAAQPGRPDRPGHRGEDRQAQPAPRQRRRLAQAGGRRGAPVAQERRAGRAPGGRAGHRHREEPDRVRRLRGPGRHRRAAARQRHVARPRRSPLGSAPRRR